MTPEIPAYHESKRMTKNVMKILHLPVVALLMTACASNARDGTDQAIQSSSSRSLSERILSRFTNVDNGLEVQRWIVQSDSERIAEVLSALSASSSIDPETLELLRRNGFRLVAIDADQLDTLRQGIGPFTLAHSEWHGQIENWRTLHHHQIKPEGRNVVINGRVRRFRTGQLQLLIRCWTVQMEDGPFVQLELVPFLATGPLHRPLLIHGRKSRTGKRIDELALTLPLESGLAYVLTYESPQVSWPGDEARESHGVRDQPPPKRRMLGPHEAVDSKGPATSIATTLGELLLKINTSPPSHDMLVFVPRIAPELYPPSGDGLRSVSAPPSDR